MRYTKYNYKRKSESTKFLLSLILTTALALSIGGVAAKMLLKVVPDKINIETEPIEEVNSEVKENNLQDFVDIYYIQCGYFSKEQNAQDTLQKLNIEFKGFIVKDETEKYRVIAGVGKEEEINELSESLSKKSIENAKIGVKLNRNDKVEEQILAIIEGILEITTTIEDKEIKNVNTNDFKEWTNALNLIEEGDKIEILKGLKNHVKEMPEEINSENSINEIEYIFNLIRQLPLNT